MAALTNPLHRRQSLGRKPQYPPLIQLDEAALALHTLHQRICGPQNHADDLQALYVRLLYELLRDTPVVPRVDQLVELSHVDERVSP
jgi:hypothetical protein